MKIMTLVSSYPSRDDGVPNIFVHKYLKALQKNGIDVFVLLMDFRSPRRKRKFGLSSYEYDGINVYKYSFPCGPIPHVLERLMSAFVCKLYKFALKTESSPDIVHAHFGAMGYVASRLKEKYGLPYIVTEHSSSILSDAAKADDERHRYYFKGYKNSNAVVCVSNALKNKIRSLDPSVSPSVIPNILGDAFFYENACKYDSFTVVSVGRLNKIKRFDILIRAIAKLNGDGHGVCLKIIGDGELSGELSSLAESLNISSKVEFTGRKSPDEIREIFKRSHVFALTSDTETFGVVYIEANACGLPAIASDCGGPSDIINGDNGIIIPKNDVDALCSAILDIRSNAKKYDPERISKLTKDIYGSDSIVSNYMKIYTDTL